MHSTARSYQKYFRLLDEALDNFRGSLFDTIPHTRLIMKVKSYGIKKITEWVQQFLGDRQQRVVL